MRKLAIVFAFFLFLVFLLNQRNTSNISNKNIKQSQRGISLQTADICDKNHCDLCDESNNSSCTTTDGCFYESSTGTCRPETGLKIGDHCWNNGNCSEGTCEIAPDGSGKTCQDLTQAKIQEGYSCQGRENDCETGLVCATSNIGSLVIKACCPQGQIYGGTNAQGPYCVNAPPPGICSGANCASCQQFECGVGAKSGGGCAWNSNVNSCQPTNGGATAGEVCFYNSQCQSGICSGNNTQPGICQGINATPASIKGVPDPIAHAVIGQTYYQPFAIFDSNNNQITVDKLQIILVENLPPGLTFNTAGAYIFGKPTGTPGSFPFTLKATLNSDPSKSVTQSFTLFIDGPTTTSTPVPSQTVTKSPTGAVSQTPTPNPTCPPGTHVGSGNDQPCEGSPTPTPPSGLPPCDNGTCDTCTASLNTCSEGNGTQNCSFTSLKSGGSECIPHTESNQVCTVSNCASSNACQNGECIAVSPTPTPVLAETNLVFSIGLDGIGSVGDIVNQDSSSSNKNPKNPKKQLTVELTDSKNNLMTKTGQITFDIQSGRFIGTISVSVPQGNYNVKVKTDKYLKRKLANSISVVSGQTIQMLPINLIAGDINGDNKLDILDYNILISCSVFGQDNGQACSNLKDNSDLNDDGVVDQYDYNLFLRELSQAQSGD